MKCLLCKFKDNNKEKLKEHYLKYQDVNENNWFFKKMINQKVNMFYGRKCNFCQDFVFLNKANHDFLKHYGKGLSNDDNNNGNLDKPIDVINIPDIKILQISFKNHSSFYDFFDSVAVVDSFLARVKDKMKTYENNVLIRAAFSIENVQLALDNYAEPLVQTRYWTTQPFQTKSLNDFVLFKLREQILKRVIINNLSGSAWHFNKFNYLNVKILDVSNKLIK